MNDIMSSPARNNIDPLICSYQEQNEKIKTASKTNSLAAKSRLLSSSQATHIANYGLSNTGFSAASSIDNIMGYSGWTPFLSRTSQPEGFRSHVSTPSSQMISTLCKQSHSLFPLDFDSGGFNLTPFLARNVNLNQGSGPNSASHNTKFTPLCDKSLRLADFFMDSPTRPRPRKFGSMTPSRLNIAPDLSKIDGHLFSELSLKRSITLIDTPARQPYKKLEQNMNDDEKEKDSISKRGTKSSDSDKLMRTALKEDTANFNNTPFLNENARKLKLKTSAHPILSPSTVIMSSVTRSPDKNKRSAPPSPTPNKDIKIDKVEPVMGTFIEKKPKMGSLIDAKAPIGKGKLKQKAGGMNRFQIVFTDVHTLINSKKKRPITNDSSGDALVSDKLENRAGRNQMKKPNGKLLQYHSSQPGGSLSPGPLSSGVNTFHGAHSYSAPLSQNFNTSINTSREFSMINNSTVNTTASNMTSGDQSSFDLMQGGLMSTPNGKYLRDFLFDQYSPGVSHNFAVKVSLMGEQEKHLDCLSTDQQQKSFMPPPKTLTLQQAAQQALRYQYMDNGSSDQAQYQMLLQHMQQMAMIHPDLQNAHHGPVSQSSKPRKGSFTISQHQPSVSANKLNESQSDQNEQSGYLFDLLHQYLHTDASTQSVSVEYSTSSPEESTKGKTYRCRARK